MKNKIIEDLETIRQLTLKEHDMINNERILKAIEYIKQTNESNHDEDKLIELIEYCFKVNKAQKKLLESQEIEIESLKLKLARKPKETVKEVLVQDDKYKQRVTKAFAQLEESYISKDEEISRLKRLNEMYKNTNTTLINENRELRKQLMEKGV